MFYPNNLPWPKIHEYILEVGAERQRFALFQKVLFILYRSQNKTGFSDLEIVMLGTGKNY